MPVRDTRGDAEQDPLVIASTAPRFRPPKWLSKLVTVKQTSFLISYCSDFLCRNTRGQITRVIEWHCITPALLDHTPVNPLVDIFLVEIFAVHQIAMWIATGDKITR